jgi:hypothetical protein
MNHKEIQSAIEALNLPASVTVKSQKKTFRADYLDGRGKPETLVAVVRWDDECGNGHNSFSVTGTLYGPDRIAGESTIVHKSGKTLWCFSGGCVHDEIERRLPGLAHLIRWHLFDPSGPMHYVANTVYHASERDHWGLLKGEFQQHTSRGKYQADGVPGVPQWVLAQPEAREVYAMEKPAPVTLEWKPQGITGEGKARDLAAARSCAAWPDATDEDLTAPGLEARLIARLPALVSQMKSEIEAIGFTY